MARYKRILGDHLQARKLPGQQAEAAIGVTVLRTCSQTGRASRCWSGCYLEVNEG
jgi:hypothetical protein